MLNFFLLDDWDQFDLTLVLRSAIERKCRWFRLCQELTSWNSRGRKVERRKELAGLGERSGTTIIMVFHKALKMVAPCVIPSIQVFIAVLKRFEPVNLISKFFWRFMVGNVHICIARRIPFSLPHDSKAIFSCLYEDWETIVIRQPSKILEDQLLGPEEGF